MSCSCSSGGEIGVMKAPMAHILVLVKKTKKKGAPNCTVLEGSTLS